MRRYPKEVHDFIANNVVGTTTKDLIDIVNQEFDLDFTESMMRSYKTNHKLKSGTPLGKPKGHSRIFTKEMQAFIEANVEGTSSSNLAKKVNSEFGTNYTRGQIKSYMSNHGLRNGLDCRIPKGNVPANKGKKMSPEMYEKCKGTMFKKGNVPVNHKPVGSERINVYGYAEVKVAEPNIWKLKHRVIWEEVKGPIPEGQVIAFLDSNSLNCEIDNLAMVSRGAHARLNQYNLRFPDKELTKTGIATAELLGGIGRAKRR